MRYLAVRQTAPTFGSKVRAVCLTGHMLKIRKIIFLIGILFVVTPVFVAQGATCDGFDPEDPYGLECGNAAGLSNSDPRAVTARIINVLLGLLGIVALVLIIYSGFKYMTAGGNEEEAKKARQILGYAVIGIAIILSAYTISIFVLRSLDEANRPGEASPLSD